MSVLIKAHPGSVLTKTSDFIYVRCSELLVTQAFWPPLRVDGFAALSHLLRWANGLRGAAPLDPLASALCASARLAIRYASLRVWLGGVKVC